MPTWSTLEFELALKALNIPQKSTVFIHSSLGMLGIHEEGKPTSGVLDCFERLSEKGIKVYLPAFTYSLSESQVFNPRSDFGLMQMGALSLESFSRGFFRTIDPIFSVLTNDPLFWGMENNRFSASFGPESLFSNLVDTNSWVLNIGTGVGTTLLHEIERRIGVPYRFDKLFNGQYLDNQGNTHNCTNWRSYVRDFEFKGSEADFRALYRVTSEEGFITRIKIGKTEISTYPIQEMANFIEKTLVRIPNLLNKKGREDLKLIPSY